MSNKTRRRLEAQRARCANALPPEIVAIVEGDTGVMTMRLSAHHRSCAEQLREIVRLLAVD